LKSGLLALLPVILLSGACNHTAAQWMPSGARAMALGINGVTLTGESAGGFNQAALATLERPACFLHCANGFLLPELSFGAFCLSLPAKPGTFAFSGSYSGTSALHELQAGLLFGRSLGKIVRAGLGMHYIEMGSCAFNHSFHTIIPTFGIQVIPHKSMTLGAVVFNPANMQFTPECSRKIPVAIAAGFAYHAGDNLLVCMEFSKESGQKPILAGGMEYLLLKRITLRFGFAGGQYPRFSLGIGLQFSALKTDLSLMHHQVLGSSPAITLSGTL